MIIEVGIVENLYYGQDDGKTWNRRLRRIPWRNEPLCNVEVELPKDCGSTLLWDFVYVGQTGLGVATGHWLHPDDSTQAVLWHTRDNGETWEEILLRGLKRGTIPERSWPPERISSALITPNESILIAWTDPWLFDYPDSHLVTIRKNADHCLHEETTEARMDLAISYGNCVRAFGFGKFWESTDSGESWNQESFSIEWKELDSDYDRDVGLLRQPQFINDNRGFALVIQRYLQELAPPITGLAITDDGGRHWRVIHQWQGPIIGDINERHVTDLKVRLS